MTSHRPFEELSIESQKRFLSLQRLLAVTCAAEHKLQSLAASELSFSAHVRVELSAGKLVSPWYELGNPLVSTKSVDVTRSNQASLVTFEEPPAVAEVISEKSSETSQASPLPNLSNESWVLFDDSAEEHVAPPEPEEPEPLLVLETAPPLPHVELLPEPSSENLPSVEHHTSLASSPLAFIPGPSPDEFDDELATTIAPKKATPPPPLERAERSRPKAAAVQIGIQGPTVLPTEEDDSLAMDDAGDEYDSSEDSFSIASVDEFGNDDSEPAPSLVNETPVVPSLPSHSSIEALLQAAHDMWEKGDFKVAIIYMTDALDAEPNHLQARIMRGHFYLDQSDFTSAMSDFIMAEEAHPDRAEPLVGIGELYFARKNYSVAIQYFDSALAIAPEQAKALCSRGIANYYLKNFTDALRDLQMAQQLDPEIRAIENYIRMAKQKVLAARK